MRVLDTPPRHEIGSNLGLFAKGAARGFGVWVAYVAGGVAVSWSAFALAAHDIWSGYSGSGGAVHDPLTATIALLLILLTPQGAASALYVVGLPLVYAVVGQKMALKAALRRVLRDRSDALADGLCGVAWPVCVKAAAGDGASTAAAAGAALREHLDARSDGRATRWLLRRTTRALRLSEVVLGADFLRRVGSEPDQARQELAAALRTGLARLTQGPLFGVLLGLAVFTAALTAGRALWVPWLSR